MHPTNWHRREWKQHYYSTCTRQASWLFCSVWAFPNINICPTGPPMAGWLADRLTGRQAGRPVQLRKPTRSSNGAASCTSKVLFGRKTLNQYKYMWGKQLTADRTDRQTDRQTDRLTSAASSGGFPFFLKRVWFSLFILRFLLFLFLGHEIFYTHKQTNRQTDRLGCFSSLSHRKEEIRRAARERCMQCMCIYIFHLACKADRSPAWVKPSLFGLKWVLLLHKEMAYSRRRLIGA